MNIAMVTNTYTPHVGGVARSVAAFAEEYRRRGHRVLVVAPAFPNQPAHESGVVRIPAIQNFNGSDFSVVLPASGRFTDALDDFGPDIVHSHHPYLLGNAALRNARYREVPLVFTHHTLYEQYTHYVPGDSPALARFVVELATRYANLTDHVFAPSESIAALIRSRGVVAPITVVPTGVDLERFADGDGAACRARFGIPADAFVVGHIGRLAPEKNLAWLSDAVTRFVRSDPRAHFLLVGQGPSEPEIRRAFTRAGVAARLHVAGVLQGRDLIDAYHALDAFAFSSFSETQGMVLTEAMAAGTPVVALDAPGVREVVTDGEDGRLLESDASPEDFAAALSWVAGLPAEARSRLCATALQVAERFSLGNTAKRALTCYRSLIERRHIERADDLEQWQRLLELVKTEWDIVKGVAGAAGVAIAPQENPRGDGE